MVVNNVAKAFAANMSQHVWKLKIINLRVASSIPWLRIISELGLHKFQSKHQSYFYQNLWEWSFNLLHLHMNIEASAAGDRWRIIDNSSWHDKLSLLSQVNTLTYPAVQLHSEVMQPVIFDSITHTL